MNIGFIPFFDIFRFGRHYEIPLLIQSILMNIAMFALIHICVSVNTKDRIAGQYKEHVFTGNYLLFFVDVALIYLYRSHCFKADYFYGNLRLILSSNITLEVTRRLLEFVRHGQ